MSYRNDDLSVEQQLIERCTKGDDKGKESLYRHFYAYAMGVGLRYSYSKDEALEIINDSFLKVFASVQKFDTASSFKPWLRRIIINTAIDHYRKQKKHMEVIEVDENQMLPEDYEDIISKLTAEDILGLLNLLPEYQRLIFNLYEIEGYSHEEIGKKLGMTTSTSRSYLTRAKAKLRILFTKKFGSVYERTFR